MAVKQQMVPFQDRQWLRQYRKVRGYDQERFGDACGISTVTYINVENAGTRSSKGIEVFCTEKTISLIANTFGIKNDLFYYPTDEKGRLTDESCIVDVQTLFVSQGYKVAYNTPARLIAMYSPRLLDIIFADALPQVV